jgi:hypothetical protein
MDSYEAVTVADIAAVLQKYPLSANTTVAIGPIARLPDA